jgi:hypothetical protein
MEGLPILAPQRLQVLVRDVLRPELLSPERLRLIVGVKLKGGVVVVAVPGQVEAERPPEHPDHDPRAELAPIQARGIADDRGPEDGSLPPYSPAGLAPRSQGRERPVRKRAV